MLGNVTQSNSYPLHSFSLGWPFLDTPFNSKYWNYGGDTAVDNNRRRISLTRTERQHQRGFLWTKNPLTGSAWVVDVEFKVHGTAGAFHGDGFAFWYTTEKEQSGPVFGSKHPWNGLGVFFDTFKNSNYHPFNFPYISVHVNDGTQLYHTESDGKQGEVGGCSSKFRNRDNPTFARIEYVKYDYMRVSVSVDGDNTWTQCAYLENAVLPDNGYLGFTSHTGDATDTHDIIKVVATGLTNPKAYKLNMDHLAKVADIVKNQARSSEGGSFDSQSGMFGEALLLVIGAAGLCLVGLGAFLMWKKKKDADTHLGRGYAKRF
ncbi:hypothetical protein HDU81_003820 [Chytriomyces hyalinus]|nr:hypothetical protein HDU81_003820 [Chytriomyces hyalinus]